MEKLIKLSETHYIVVDDSIRGQSGYNYNFGLSKIEDLKYSYGPHSTEWNCCKKITHSTQPLSDVKFTNFFDKIKPLSLSEAEEAVYGYSVENLADNYVTDESYLPVHKEENYRSYINGFKAHQELVKDKLFTIEDIEKAFEEGVDSQFMTVSMDVYEVRENYRKTRLRTFIQSLLPKTEWGIEFVDGKLKLL